VAAGNVADPRRTPIGHCGAEPSSNSLPARDSVEHHHLSPQEDSRLHEPALIHAFDPARPEVKRLVDAARAIDMRLREAMIECRDAVAIGQTHDWPGAFDLERAP
jgi:hypothetical protein